MEGWERMKEREKERAYGANQFSVLSAETEIRSNF